ncbi:hypothetical protein [Candidatus Phytoplasma mali]|uniref:hypothetical protein n=1 Tax=Apple proliferation phytoplasma TaxID=37692 RepID=UPI0011D04D81
MKKLIKNDSEFLTIFYNKKLIRKKNLNNLKSFLKKNFVQIEIEMIENEEKNIFYIFSIE